MKIRSPWFHLRVLPVVLFSCLSILLVATGCSDAIPGAPPPAPSVNISASPAQVAKGSTAMLSVAASNATSVSVTGSDGSSYTLPADGGTQPVNPTTTTTYTATATGPGGTSTATSTVTVAAATAPTVNILASPMSITAGSSSMLTVTATNATTVTVTGSDGSSYSLAVTGGTQSVSPTATTTYTATATGPGGTITSTATVTVSATTNPAPTVTIAASPTSISSGGSSTLTVAATNATSVVVTGNDGSSYTLSATGGTQSVSPTATTTYTATATGAGGKTSATTTVTIGSSTTPAPTVTIAANPGSIAPGGSSTLTVAAANATGVTLTGSDGSSYTLASTGGTQSVKPTSTTTYTATATGTGGKISATATVTVTSPAPTVNIAANPTSITAGNSSTLTVTATNATAVTISGSDGSSYTLASNGGAQSVKPTSTTTYTATATGAGGKISASAVVTVTPAASPVVTFTASQSTITAGSSTTLTVTATNSTSVTITGSDGSSYTLAGTGGTQSVSPTKTTTYTATATGPGGKSSQTTTVTVNPKAAPTVTITANPSSITAGSSSVLTVTANNATGVTVQGSDGSSYTLQASGGTQSVTPSATTTYTATATGAGGTTTAAASVTVTPAPTPTVAITANPTSISSGSSSTLTVTATNATGVVVTGSDSSSYTLAASGGTQIVTPKSTTTYTATATGTGGKTATATAKVTVVTGSAFVLTVNNVGTGSGTVTSSPAGINCPQTCTATFANGTAVELTATPEAGTTFAGWSGPCTGLKTCDITLADNTTVTSTFEQGTAGIDSLQHIIFFAQENRSLDDYFGAMREYWKQNGIPDQSFDGLPQFNPTSGLAPLYGPPPAIPGCDPTSPYPGSCIWDPSNTVASFHMTSVCNENTSPSWNEAHVDWNYQDQVGKYPPAKNNGFVHTAAGDARANPGGPFYDTNGIRAMGYWDGTDMNYDYFMASNFATSDRFFQPVLARTELNRAYLDSATSGGYVHANGTDTKDEAPHKAPPIFEELQNAGITWKVYINPDGTGCAGPPYTAACLLKTVDLGSFSYAATVLANYPQNVAPISEYFTDLTDGTLPQVAEIYAGSDAGLDEHGSVSDSTPINIQHGARYTSTLINALMESSYWQTSAFIFTFDESGGLYDHVSPQPAVSPDGIKPVDLLSTDVCATITGPLCDFVWTGYRIPFTVISPYAKKNYVSHTVMDETAILKFIEERFNLPPLNQRDAAQPDITEFFDFNNPQWMSPPVPPTQNISNPCYLNKLP